MIGSPLILPVPKTPWLPRESHRQVAAFLIEHGLCRLDNSRQSPLASGTTTDAYIDLRMGRSHPLANYALAGLYAHPIRWLDVDRFLEVPEAVSGLAALTSHITGIPYATIRKHPKEGRVSDAYIVGEVKAGEHVVIFDDVITDGESKLLALRVCQEQGLRVRAIVVLVDRQQGWQHTLAGQGIDVPVWAGMTLHDFRREAIALGAMARCDPLVENDNPLIVAIDGKSFGETLAIADRLRPTGCILKINDLAIAEGCDRLLPELAPYGRVMVDIKCHDIPASAINIAERLRPHAPWAVTLHGDGGEEMISGVVACLPGTHVFVVTLLTSFDEAACREIYHQSSPTQVRSRARIGYLAGADGLICAQTEVSMLRTLHPRVRIAAPGNRSPGSDAHDQKRVGTPTETLSAGADYVIMGRQIMDAPDPLAEVKRILREECG